VLRFPARTQSPKTLPAILQNHQTQQEMKIELYATFDSVFTDGQLKGIFYPLCGFELNDEKNTKLFFVSSNGIWTNESNSTENNNNTYTNLIL